MGTVAVDINQLNRAIIVVGSRTSLSQELGRESNYITYVIASGEMEEEEAEHIAKKYNIDVIVGDTRLLGQGSSINEEPEQKQVRKHNVHQVRSCRKPTHDEIDSFVEKFCIIGESEALLGDLFTVYKLSAHSQKYVGLSKDAFLNHLFAQYDLEPEKMLVEEAFDYQKSLFDDSRSAFHPLPRMVVKGISFKTDALKNLLWSEFNKWVSEKCEPYVGESNIEELMNSYNSYYQGCAKLSLYFFKTVLTFMGYSLKCEKGSNFSTSCHGIRLKDSEHKPQVYENVIKTYNKKPVAELPKNEVRNGDYTELLTEIRGMREEQEKTNALLKELITIWK